MGEAREARLIGADAYAVPREPSRVAFDADELGTTLIVRARRRGERFVAFGGAERRLKTLLIEAKVPRWDRGRVPVVEAGGTIVWGGQLRRGGAGRRRARPRRSRVRLQRRILAPSSAPWRTRSARSRTASRRRSST